MALLFNTFSNSIFDDIINDSFAPVTKTHSQFDVEVLEDGKQKVTINTTGHNPKDMTVNVTEENIHIKSDGKNTSRFVKDIDLTLTVGKDYDGTKSSASFENGLLTLLIDKKETKKGKTLKISY
jgi:HSP20 family molecular chaperone IbpA